MNLQNDQKELTLLTRLVEALNVSNSSLYKKQVLAEYPECKELLKITYNPFITFGITSKTIRKNEHLYDGRPPEHGLWSLLGELEKRELTGHNAIRAVLRYINHYKSFRSILYKVIDRNLKTRADAKLINQVWPGLIPIFGVALAYKYDKYKDKIDLENDRWFGSRKLDGIRCSARIDNQGEITFYSRRGKRFETLNNLIEPIKSFNLSNVVPDGEICIIDENGEEDFQSVLRLIRRKNFTIEKPRFRLFDLIPLEEFDNQEGNILFSKRWRTLTETFGNKESCLEVIPQIPLEPWILEDLIKQAAKYGWEGVMIRKDTFYKGRRSADLLKIKEYQDAEYKVLRAEMGLIRIIVNGKEIEEEMLSAVKINHKGYEVSVGSGFKIPERQYYYRHPEEIVGRVITVRYFEETKNEKGDLSLRFPIFKAIHGRRREV